MRVSFLRLDGKPGASFRSPKPSHWTRIDPRFASGDPVVVIGSLVITDRFPVVGKPLSAVAVGSYQRHIVEPDSTSTSPLRSTAVVIGNVAYMSGAVKDLNRTDIPIGTPFFTAVADNSEDGIADMTVLHTASWALPPATTGRGVAPA